MFEVLEARALLADGITPSPGAPISAVAGAPITNAIFATYTVSDPSGAPGTQWRAEIQFGDGQVSKQTVPVQDGSVFDIEATHTYSAPGTYTVTVMIAVPGSHKPNDNTVTMQVTVTSPTPTTPTPTPTTPTPTPTTPTPTPTTPTPTPTTPTPTPTTPPSSIGLFQASGLSGRAKVARTIHKAIARFSDPNTLPTQFGASIDWGDQSGSTPGQIKRQGKGRYVVVGSHRYQAPGAYQVTITIRDAAGDVIAAHSSVTVTGKKR
jgi:PKD repeat protein